MYSYLKSEAEWKLDLPACLIWAPVSSPSRRDSCGMLGYKASECRARAPNFPSPLRGSSYTWTKAQADGGCDAASRSGEGSYCCGWRARSVSRKDNDASRFTGIVMVTHRRSIRIRECRAGSRGQL